MIIVKGCIPLNQDGREEAVALIREMADGARRERGCLAYEVYLSVEDPDTVVLWQQWRSLEALEAHFASDHVDTFLEMIPDYIDGEVTTERFDVQTDEAELPEDDGSEAVESPSVRFAGSIVLH